MCANLFPNHHFYWGDQHYETTVGPERAMRMNACATALANGVPLAIHSDAPVTPLGPIFTAWCAVNRLTASGRVLGTSECISVADALRTITLGAAWTLKLDGEVGSIECGKRADFCVLEDDPLTVDPASLKAVPRVRRVSAPPLAWRGGLPVTVIGGYLGAGKTTLVNHLLRHADGRRICVLVNDFGAVPIDRDLIVSADGDTLEISGGCVCCSYGSDLMETLGTLRSRWPGIEHVLLEASGVALPGAVASSVGLLPSLRVDGIVVVADAETVRAKADDAYLGDTIHRQLAAADLVILNRCDLAGPRASADMLTWLGNAASRARIVGAERAVVEPALILGLDDGRMWVGEASPAPDAANLYESVDLALPPSVDVAALAARLAVPTLGILRAKAIVDAGERRLALHVVGARVSIDEAPATAQPSEQADRLVAIGVRGQLDGAAIRRTVAAR
jgi:G3E family GTPase